MVTPICEICRRPSYSSGNCPISEHCKRQPKLNLGCGISPKQDYINFDANVYGGIQGWDKHLQTDVTGMIEDVLDIFPHDYFQEIMSAHTIEHFFFEDALTFLKNQFILLRPGGKVVVEGPCMLGLIRWFQEGRCDIRGHIENHYPYHNRMEYGPLMMHKSGWTGPVLAEEMEKLGYQIIHIGEGLTHGCGWRDFRVEGVKN